MNPDIAGFNKQQDTYLTGQAVVPNQEVKRAFIDRGSVEKARGQLSTPANSQIQAPILTPPVSGEKAGTSLAEVVSKLNIPFPVTCTSKQLDQYLSRLPQGQTIPDTDGLTVKNLFEEGHMANNIRNWSNAPAVPSTPIKNRSPLTPFPSGEGSSQAPGYVVSQATKDSPQITVGELLGGLTQTSQHQDPKIRQAQAVYQFIDQAAKEASQKFPSTSTTQPKAISLTSTEASPEQINQEMNNLIGKLPEKTAKERNTKSIMLFIEQSGGEAGVNQLPPQTPIPGTTPPLTAADLQKTTSPSHKVLVEVNSLRAILAVLIQLKNTMNSMQEYISQDINDRAKENDTSVELTQTESNRSVAKATAVINDIQTAVKSAEEAAKKSSIFGWIGMALSAIVLIASVIAIPFSGGSSLALGLAIFSVVVSAGLLGVQTYEQASGNKFMDNAIKNGFSDIMKDLRNVMPKGLADAVAALIMVAMIVAVVAVTKGAGLGATAAGATAATKMAIIMATVSLAATVLSSSNIIGSTITDIAKDCGASKKTADLIGSITQAVLVLVVSIGAGILAEGGGAGAAAKAGEKGAEDAEGATKEASEAASSSSSSDEIDYSGLDVLFSETDETAAGAAKTATSTDAAATKEITAAEKILATLRKTINSLLKSLGVGAEDTGGEGADTSMEDGYKSTQRNLMKNLRLQTASYWVQRGASGAQLISSITNEIFQGTAALTTEKAKKDQAANTADLAQINALLQMFHANLKQLNQGTEQLQSLSSEITKEYAEVFSALQQVMPDMSKMMQKLFSTG